LSVIESVCVFSVAKAFGRDAGVRAIGLALGSALALAATPAAAADQPVTVAPATVTGVRSPAVSGPSVSPSGAGDYAVSAQDIADLPTGGTSPITDVLAQMPGVAIDQNQQIHIRNTEGPQFQYQINGVLVPIDINTNPPFVSMINPQFIKRLDLIDGVLPSRYSYATGGVVDIQTKDGCEASGGDVTVRAGQLEVLQTSGQFGGCAGKLSYYGSALYGEGQTAFSSATPGRTPIHDFTNQGQAFGYFSYDLTPQNRLSLILSAAASDNQLPNVAGLTPAYTLAGVSGLQSQDINSQLNFRDYLGIVAFNGSTSGGLTYQLAYSAHFISQAFRPDDAGELIFQGVASTTTHRDIDNTLEGDVTDRFGRHTLSAGFYAGRYAVTVDDTSLVFPVFDVRSAPAQLPVTPTAPALPGPDDGGPPVQSSTTPFAIVNNNRAINVVLGVYIGDLWRITNKLSVDAGLRLDSLTGFTSRTQLNPTINFAYQWSPDATVHAGFARYTQAPSFQGISANAPDSFSSTTGEGLLGNGIPLAEDDLEWDVGGVLRLGRHFTVSQDNYYERTFHYLDTGQLGLVPIFAPFNYGMGTIWGSEFAVNYRSETLSAYANLTLGQNFQKGVDTGQFNFERTEVVFIDLHAIPLDHQPLAGMSAGAIHRFGPYSASLSAVYSSGLRGGFADQDQLPPVVQVNASLERRFDIPGIGKLVNRLTILNVTDRVNLIRPSEGIGISQSAYGPRFTVLDSLTLPF
jgi:TonB dependent receptor/TonB-dependent Receptor Plug Domain